MNTNTQFIPAARCERLEAENAALRDALTRLLADVERHGLWMIGPDGKPVAGTNAIRKNALDGEGAISVLTARAALDGTTPNPLYAAAPNLMAWLEVAECMLKQCVVSTEFTLGACKNMAGIRAAIEAAGKEG